MRAEHPHADRVRRWDAGEDGWRTRRPREPCDESRTCRRCDARPVPTQWGRRHDAADPTAHDGRHRSDRDELRHSAHRDERADDCHWCRCSTEPDDRESDAVPNPSTSPTRRRRRHPTNSTNSTRSEHRDAGAAPRRCALLRTDAALHRWEVASNAEADRCRSRRSATPAATDRRRRSEARRNRRRRRDRRPDRCRLSGATCRRS